MKRLVFGASIVAATLALTGAAYAYESGYNPLSLDHFVTANVAMATAKAKVANDKPLSNDEIFLLAQKGLQYDAEGFLIGPDGKRIKPLIRPTKLIGVFR